MERTGKTKARRPSRQPFPVVYDISKLEEQCTYNETLRYAYETTVAVEKQ
jgi:hypothetical protein